MFEGLFILSVKDTEHVQRLLDKIKKIKGVIKAERLEQSAVKE
jgi:hypothetical protein